mmetsp:Transcript_5655/g.9811  ORF Transcript_5655/g.9811 Transcript_5655/m.9811 type:complete len:210 (+) Transcript_5655:328-957(+)
MTPATVSTVLLSSLQWVTFGPRTTLISGGRTFPRSSIRGTRNLRSTAPFVLSGLSLSHPLFLPMVVGRGPPGFIIRTVVVFCRSRCLSLAFLFVEFAHWPTTVLVPAVSCLQIHALILPGVDIGAGLTSGLAPRSALLRTRTTVHSVLPTAAAVTVALVLGQEHDLPAEGTAPASGPATGAGPAAIWSARGRASPGVTSSGAAASSCSA